jgi:hypothetical protein
MQASFELGIGGLACGIEEPDRPKDGLAPKQQR